MYKIIIPLMLLLASCSYVPAISPYKIDIQQGNVVTQEMVSKLKPGMTKSQTKFVLGTPLITDAFHADRWDYVYLLNKGGKLLEQRKLTVIFEGDVLKRLEGDVAASTPEDIKAAESASAKSGDAQSVKADQKVDGAKAEKEEKGFFGRMLEKIGL